MWSDTVTATVCVLAAYRRAHQRIHQLVTLRLLPLTTTTTDGLQGPLQRPSMSVAQRGAMGCLEQVRQLCAVLAQQRPHTPIPASVRARLALDVRAVD